MEQNHSVTSIHNRVLEVTATVISMIPTIWLAIKSSTTIWMWIMWSLGAIMSMVWSMRVRAHGFFSFYATYLMIDLVGLFQVLR